MNERNAGRKRKFDTETINKILKAYHKGHSVSELAREYGVSRQTMSFYIHDVGAEVETTVPDEIGMLVRSLSYWKKNNQYFELTNQELLDYALRLDYMLDETVLSTILVDYKHERVLVKNFTDHPMKRAFGVKKNPTWEDYLLFLEDRCVPKSRDYMKLILRDYNLDFFDPLLIIRKTGGHMAEDRRYLRIIDLEVDDENV